MKQKDKATNSGNPFEEYSLKELKRLVEDALGKRMMYLLTLIEHGMALERKYPNEHME